MGGRARGAVPDGGCALTPFGNVPDNISAPGDVWLLQARKACAHSEDLVQVVLVKVKELRTRGSFSFQWEQLAILQA